MAHEFTEDDEGKSVVNDQSDEVGVIASVEHGTAYVDPDPGMTDKIKSKLGWDDRDEDTYPLQSEAVDSVTDDEVHLGSDTTSGAGGPDTEGGPTGTGGADGTGGTDDDGLLGDDDTQR